ncbi:inositol monophosphatase [Kribbella sp. NPDC048915]|uniref:inositol monophosphatase family protein n=1 Tax=Kribbella sp. NPDC048915 TaxID=3155148 RepID=UPI0033C53814
MDDFDLAFAAVGRAAEVAMRYFEKGVEASLKADGTPVTEADRAVEELLRAELTAVRPGDGLWGEEFGRVGESERTWILDPIDGTRFFAAHDPNWRIQLALHSNGVAELAVVVAPALNTCWWATRGGGAFESSWPRDEPRPLRVSTTASYDHAVLEALGNYPRFGPPSSPLPLVGLVRGEVDAFLVERYYAWDHAPWILIVEEAGGRFTDRKGGRAADQGGGLYSNAALHDQLRADLRYPGRF